MTNLKYVIILIVLLPVAACTYFYRGDGKYIVDRYYLFASYSIEFPDVPLDREGVYEYNFDNYYTANTGKRLEFDIRGEDIVPTSLSTHIKFEVFNKHGTLVAFMDGPLNGREMAFFKEPLVYPDISWWGHCSKFYNSFDYDIRKTIAKDPNNKELLDEYVRKFKIEECTFTPSYSPESKFHDDWDGEKIESFHEYKVILTVSRPNTSLKNLKGRLALRSGWK